MISLIAFDSAMPCTRKIDNSERIGARENGEEVIDLMSQNAISRSHGGRRYLPWVFTEHSSVEAAVPAAITRNLAGDAPATTAA